MARSADLSSILNALGDGGIDFVLVGALAAVTQGAPVTTHDVDIVHSRLPENIDRLMAVLTQLGARYRGRPISDPLPPDRRALETTGHSLFVTDLGPLDCLGSIETGLTYSDLLPLSVELQIGGRPLRVLGLETIVRLKRSSTQLKDRLVLPVLEQTLLRLRAALDK